MTLVRDEDIEIEDIVRRAAARAPLITPPPWSVAEGPRLALALDGDREPDRAAWIQLGVTLEAIAVAGAAVGLAFSIDPATAPPLAVASQAATTSISATTHRLAACLRTPAAGLRPVPARIAAHVSARLATAASVHECTLAWFESARSVGEVMALLDAPPPADGVSAIGIVATDRTDREGLVRGGRAACRVWLEAVSLGLAVQPIRPLLQSGPPAGLGIRAGGVLVAALSFGPTA